MDTRIFSDTSCPQKDRTSIRSPLIGIGGLVVLLFLTACDRLPRVEPFRDAGLDTPSDTNTNIDAGMDASAAIVDFREHLFHIRRASVWDRFGDQKAC